MLTAMDIGDRLRRLRVAKGLSQRDVARRAGVTNATISMIENNKISPSVASLKKILDGLLVPLADFFGSGRERDERVFFAADELTEIAGGKISFRQVGDDLRGRALQVLHETYQPRADTGRAMLGHEGEEAGIVICGRIEITVGDARRVLGPGDAYYYDSSFPHRFRNVGNEPCEIISVCTPPNF
jgi:transcriptional regulator with XRE-family HTH domain